MAKQGNHTLESMMEVAERYRNTLTHRQLQPYETLMYQQMCRTIQTWCKKLDKQLSEEIGDDTIDKSC